MNTIRRFSIAAAVVGVGALLGAGPVAADTAAAPFTPVAGSPFDVSDSATALAFSPLGDLLAVGDSSDGVTLYSVGPTTVSDVGPALGVGSGSSFLSLAFNPSGDLLAGADLGNGGSLSSVNGTTATEAGSFVSDLGEISVAFSPSNGMLASANALDSTVSLYSISGTTATSIGSVPSTSLNFPFAVAFSPSGDLLAVANAGNDTVSLFSMEDQSPTLVGAPLAVSGSPQSVAFSPSGDLLAVADTSTNSVSVFSIDGTTATPIEPDLDTGEDSSPTSVAFSPSGDLLATANETSDTVSLFTVANDTVTPLGSPLPVGDEPFAVAFSPSGGMLATANDAVSAGGAISVFSVGPPSATIDMPAGGGTYGLGQAVPTTFSCVDAPYTTGLDACTDSNGDSSGGGGLFTGTLGTHTYTVTATSKDGQTASTRISYTVVPDPTATITAPGSGGTYTVGQNVTTGFSCAEGAGGPGLSSCGDSTGGAAGPGRWIRPRSARIPTP